MFCPSRHRCFVFCPSLVGLSHAGNLTLLGSVANLIVAERAKAVYPLTFVEYAIIGVPSTIVLCAVGTPIVWMLTNAVGA